MVRSSLIRLLILELRSTVYRMRCQTLRGKLSYFAQRSTLFAERFDSNIAEVSKIVLQLRQVLHRTEQLQVGLDALRADHRLGLDSSRTEQLQNGLEALRADHQLGLDTQRLVDR